MGHKLKITGWIALGALAGALTTVSLQTVARNTLAPLPLEELQQLAAVFGMVKSDYVEPVDEKKLISDAISGMVAGLDPHSQYFDNLHMLSISRGGQVVWMSAKDAEKIGVADNDWIELYNRNGVVSARAIVTHRIPEGTAIMNHAQERTTGTPLNEHTGRRGGTHNSLTRIMIKPLHVAGGYGHITYGFNYIGPTGNNRDEVTRIRRRSQEVKV